MSVVSEYGALAHFWYSFSCEVLWKRFQGNIRYKHTFYLQAMLSAVDSEFHRIQTSIGDIIFPCQVYTILNASAYQLLSPVFNIYRVESNNDVLPVTYEVCHSFGCLTSN